LGEFYNKYRLFFIILVILVTGFLLWYFSNIVIFIIVAVVLSIIGSPLVELLDKIRIWKFKFPHVLSVIIVLLLMIILFFGLTSFFIPLIVKEADMISNIDGKALMDYYKYEIAWSQNFMLHYGIIPRGATLESSLKVMALKLLDFDFFSNILSKIIAFAGTFLFSLFSILFLTFFFLYDTKMMPRLILLIVPAKYEDQTRNVMIKSKQLLSRYFLGLIIQVFLNILTYSLALTIIGVKGALVIGFFAGIIIVIPYLGGIIAIITGVVLGITGMISIGDYAHIGSMAIKIIIAMFAVQLVDNNVFQPYIQGKAVRAHPVEIFLLIIAAASIGGIPAMIIAIPAYGFLKIVAVEFLSQFRLVKRMSDR
jgi:predicted PurR-regulated permease PerM